MKNLRLSLFLLALFLGSAISLQAKSPESTFEEGLLSGCPFYDVRSVNADLSLNGNIFSPGTPIVFSTKIRNTNQFPIDASLLVTITDANGNIVDRFIADTGKLILPEQSNTSAAFSWNIPTTARVGTYVVLIHVIDYGQFYVGGIPYINGMFAGETSFRIAGNNKSFAVFDPSSVKEEGNAVTTLINHNQTKEREAVVTWKMYSGNLLEPVDSFIEKISLEPGKPSHSSFVIKKDLPQYDVVGELSFDGSKSIVYRHFSNSTSSSAISLLAFASKSGVINLLGCIDNFTTAGDESKFPKTVAIYVKDAKGTEVLNEKLEISRSPLAGFITPSISTASGKLDINAVISDAKGVEENRARIIYDCSDLSSCGERGGIPFGGIAAFFGGIAILVLMARMRKKNLDTPINPKI